MASAGYLDAPLEAKFPPLDRDLSVDVAVVGAGITGVTTAWLLKQAGLSVAVLEARQPAAGASGLSTGYLDAGLACGYQKLIAELGESAARVMVESSAFAIDFVEETVRNLGLSCAFERVAGYRYVEAPADVARLVEEGDAAARLGLGCTLVRELGTPFPVAGALRIDRQAQLDPRAYLAALAGQVEGDGSSVHGDTRVDAIVDGAPARLQTGEHVVHARTIVLATHLQRAGARSLEREHGLEPRTRCVLALRVDEAPLGLYWDHRRPHDYFHVRGDQLLVSGLDPRLAASSGCFERLDAHARARFVVRAEEARWSSLVLDAAGGLPFLGQLPGAAHVLTASGYAAAGLTYGTVAALVLADLVTEQHTRPGQPTSSSWEHGAGATDG